jgi:hypothetical protein
MFEDEFMLDWEDGWVGQDSVSNHRPYSWGERKSETKSFEWISQTVLP